MILNNDDGRFPNALHLLPVHQKLLGKALGVGQLVSWSVVNTQVHVFGKLILDVIIYY